MSRSSAPTAGKKPSFLKSENGKIVLIFVVFIIAITLVDTIMNGTPKFVAPSNWLNIFMQVTVVGIMSMGMATVMIGGGIDLSIGMLTSFVALFVAKAYTDWGVPIAAAIIIVIVLSILFEAGQGFIISRFKVEPFIITLGGMIAIKGVALIISNSREVTMSGALDWFKVNMIPEGLKDPISGLPLVLQVYVLVFVVVGVLFWFMMKYTKFGRRVYAVGANRQAAYLAGINVKNTVFATYLINGLLVGIGGIVLMTRVNTAIITIGQNLEIDVIAAVVVGGVAMSGGKGNIIGVILGVFLMGAIANGMNILRIQADWQYVVKGAIIIVVVSAGAFAATMQEKNLLRQQKDEHAHQKQIDEEENNKV